MRGLMNEEYSAALARKIHRGQQGRVLQGYVAGGRRYGYRNVPVQDPSRQDHSGMPAVIGVRLEVVPEQAEVIRRIFAWRADGHRPSKIATMLTAEGIPSPTNQTGSEPLWRSRTVTKILANELYRGVFIWNRTGKELDPETGQTKRAPKAQAEWLRVDVPQYRLVSDETWNKVQAMRLRRVGIGGDAAEKCSRRDGELMHGGVDTEA
jgi:site-specific DNA recombinase